MATVILKNKIMADRVKNEIPNVLERVFGVLPSGIAEEISGTLSYLSIRENYVLEEIRLRVDRCIYLTVGSPSGKKNIALSHVLTKDELSNIFEHMCNGSLYAYGESIVKGYISLGDGIRVGICGRAALDNGKIKGVYDISSLNIRLPSSPVRLDAELYLPILRSVQSGGGVLIYSPPAQGKTTLLRSLGAMLSGGDKPMRVVIADSRDELGSASYTREHSLDLLCGYPKAEAILIATTFMSPEVIICDEIGLSDEAKAILEAQNCGVPLVASAHGEKLSTLLQRPQIRVLHDAGVFSLYVGIRISGKGKFEYRIQTKKEADAALEAYRNTDDIDLRDSDRSHLGL
jgi:stage III sporulation protein AA